MTVTPGSAAEIILKSWMPPGTRLRQLMIVTPRLRACQNAGLGAIAIRLDDGELDAGTSIDIGGEHRLTATFAGAGTELLSGPIALDWYDDLEGHANRRSRSAWASR